MLAYKHASLGGIIGLAHAVHQLLHEFKSILHAIHVHHTHAAALHHHARRLPHATHPLMSALIANRRRG
jgi:hypothetical protein